MTRRIALLAYMFPPIVDGGAFRPTAFARYLPEFGYEPIVLTRPDTANLPVDPRQLEGQLSAVRVERVDYGFTDGWQDHFRRRLAWLRSEDHTSELQSPVHLVCRLLLEKKKAPCPFTFSNTLTFLRTAAS